MSIPTSIESPARRYIIKNVRGEGDLTTLYNATYAFQRPGNGSHNGSTPDDNHVVIKVSRDKADNDLVWNEAGILGFMYPPEQATEKLYQYLPRLIDAFETKDGHRANVFQRIDGYHSLEEILRAFPKGINFRDMVWMYKRLLVAIGLAHSKGIIHGAVLPAHVLVHPQEHGAKLLDWSYALNFAEIVVKPKGKKDPEPDPVHHKARNAWEKLLVDADYDPDPVDVKLPPGPPADPNRMYIRAVSTANEHFYAPEVFAKKTPLPGTDLYMAAKCAVALLGGDVETNQLPDTVPQQIKAFLQSSLTQATRHRPADAWDLHESLDRLLLGLVGKPTYRLFSMPSAN